MSLSGALREQANGDINAPGTAITIHSWVNPTDLSSDRNITCRWGNSSARRQFLLAINAQKANAFIADSGGFDQATGATTVSTNAWHAITLRKNGTGAGALQVWLDGAQDGSVTSNRSAQSLGAVTGSQFRIAQGSDGSNSMAGVIADVAIWLVALTDGEMIALSRGVSPLKIRPASIYHYWPLYNDFILNDLSPAGYALNSSLGGTGDPSHAPAGSPYPV